MFKNNKNNKNDKNDKNNIDIGRRLDSMAEDLKTVIYELRIQNNNFKENLTEIFTTSIPEVRIYITATNSRGRGINPTPKEPAETYTFQLHTVDYHEQPPNPCLPPMPKESEEKINMCVSAKATLEELKDFQEAVVISIIKELQIKFDKFTEALTKRAEQKKAISSAFDTSYQASIKPKL